MLYSEVIEYLYQKLPLFQNQGATALKSGLSGILKLSDYFDQPQNKFRSIHIAGTNGKGSSSHMLASILHEAGYKTGLYTSPHLVDFRERIKINGQVITKEYVIDFVEQHKAFFEQNSFSFFEVTVALAFKFFAENQVDIAIIEVGLGGRLDSTNIIKPILSLITNISDDHKKILGDTLPQIAFEKAGIIKENVPVVIASTQPQIDQVFIEKAQLMGAEIEFADKKYTVLNTKVINGFRQIEILDLSTNTKKVYDLDLTGSYQVYNLLGVLAIVAYLSKLNIHLDENTVCNGLRKVIANTGLMGRWQILAQNPMIICDTGHNYAGILEVINNLNDQKFNDLHIVLGFVKDKEVDKILKLFPKNAQYYFCNANIPRALPVDDLADLASQTDLKGNKYESVSEAFNQAKKQAQKQDLIFIGGSTFIVADLLTYLQKYING
jgi:dihydrofolate synthase / folylpolyglutamate synthase